MVKLNKKNRDQQRQLIVQALNTDKMKRFRKKFLELHPSDQIDLFLTFTKEQRDKVYSYLSPEEFAMIFGNLYVEEQEEIFSELHDSYASEMLNHMFTDEIVTFLKEIEHEEITADILNKMDAHQAKQVRSLLAYAHETAGAIMTKEFISISSTDTAGEVIEQLREEAPNAEIIYYNYVVDTSGRLVGVVSLRELITAPPHEKIENIMSTQVVSVPEDMDQEEVGNFIKKYDLLAAPVVSKHNHRLLGIVTVDDVMDILEEETTEDFGEISAVRDATDMNLSAFTAAKKRSPWIITLMFFGMITAGVMNMFEETLEAVVLLAIFVPMIMDSAGNVGTQSLTVAVRGLALGTIEKGSFWKMIRREMATGAIIGIICMFIIIILISILYKKPLLAGIVGFSLLCTLTVSTVVGATVPLLIHKLRLDPAIASGPFITTINDILGLMIYFSVATAFMGML